MLVKNTLTLTTFSMLDPASLSTAERFWMQSSVMAEMEEDSRVRISPAGLQGISRRGGTSVGGCVVWIERGR
jgi:hypothetical protein